MKDKNGRPIIIVKKKVVTEGHHSGAWKVAYADFVTAMMSLFIVLWLMNSNTKVREAVAGYFKDPSGTGRMLGTTKEGKGGTEVVVKTPNASKPSKPPDKDQPIVKPPETARQDQTAVKPPQIAGQQSTPKADMDKLKDDLEKALKNLPTFPKVKDHVAITVASDGVRIELMETAKGLFFENGSPVPTEEGRAVLRAASALLEKMPNRVTIEGHTDSVPYVGTSGYSNWELSSDRANAARIIMQKSGLRPGQIVQIRGFADQQLRLPDRPTDPSNRRISIIVMNLPDRSQVSASPGESKKPAAPGAMAAQQQRPGKSGIQSFQR